MVYLKVTSHLERGAWIEISRSNVVRSRISRTSKEVRGLKFLAFQASYRCKRRTSKEVRGLKYSGGALLLSHIGRTSKEVRGLKFDAILVNRNNLASHLERGAWIEIM